MMASPATESAVVAATTGNGSPATSSPTMLQQTTASEVPQTLVMTPNTTSGGQSASGQNTHLMMQPPMSLPLMMPPYQMILPQHGIVDQQGLIQQHGTESPAHTPGSPHPGSRSTTPLQTPVTTLYQQQNSNEAVSSPARQGSVGSGGSPAPPTPGSLGSPLPQMMADGSMQVTQGMQLPLQPGQMHMTLPLNIAGLQQQQQQTTVVPQIKEEEKKVDISQLKQPKKPLTPYMRFSKTIWPNVKAAHQHLSVCEIGATIGRMWRELADAEKQKYNEEFANDKIRYDVDIQHYLKITGLQPSDLVKQRTKKKSSSSAESKAKRQHTAQVAAQQAAAAQQQQQQQQQLVQSSINGPVPVTVQGSMGTTNLSQQVLSGALSGLPHFSQVWAGQPGQEQQVIVQGAPGQPQQVVINALGLPPGTVVNGSTASDNPNVISGPILIQQAGDQATQLFSTDGQQAADGSEVKTDGDGQTATSQAVGPVLSWHQVVGGNPGDLQQQQNVLNLLNLAAQQSGVQPDQLTQAAQIAGLQPPTLGLNHQILGSSDSTGESLAVVSSAENGVSLANGPTSSASSIVTFAGMPTAHTLYNSYGISPWSAFPQQILQADGTTTTQEGGIQVVYNRESILETELQHLRSALSEKTKEVQRLTQELEKAYSIIEQLKQQNPTAVIHLPAPQEPHTPDSGTPTTTMS